MKCVLLKEKCDRMRGLRIFMTGLMAGLTIAAIDKELGKPPTLRT